MQILVSIASLLHADYMEGGADGRTVRTSCQTRAVLVSWKGADGTYEPGYKMQCEMLLARRCVVVS